MTPMLTLAILLYAVNAVLFSFLAYVYGRTALSTRAKYPLGLFVFSILLLLHSAGTAVAYFFLGPYFGEEAIPYMSVMGSFELVGVLALLRITL
ncbi:MAG TPA: hypothetical protein VGR53_09410 [Nitrososphaerales archaeon]|nr:hypothetical protein [Nitrososphaerales archaeon]